MWPLLTTADFRYSKLRLEQIYGDGLAFTIVSLPMASSVDTKVLFPLRYINCFSLHEILLVYGYR